MCYTLGGGFVRLVDMDALDRPTESLGRNCWIRGAGVGRLATDGVVEDEDSGGASAGDDNVSMANLLGLFALMNPRMFLGAQQRRYDS